MRLFMIRHGESENNSLGIYTGQYDAKLTALGQDQARALQPILKEFTFDRVYSSDLSRAMETCLLALPGIEVIPTPLLREIDTGELTCRPFKEVKERCGNLQGHFSPFGGEDPADVIKRLEEFLAPLEANPCDYVAAFAHGGVLRGMLNHATHSSISTLNLLSPNCNIAVFDYNGERWRLLAWNYGGKL